MPSAFAMLGQSHSRFDAVSRDELPYWLTDVTDLMAEEYFKAGTDPVRKGKHVTRMFLLSQDQIRQREVLKEVLKKHLLVGIAIAVVSLDQLPTYLKRRAKELDFALWDLGSAYSMFRQREDGYARKMRIVFSKGGANDEVATKVALYRELMTHAWLVNETYSASHQGLIAELLPQLNENNSHLLRLIGGRIQPEENFFIKVTGKTELSQKVDNLLTLWELARATEEGRPTTDNTGTSDGRT